MNIVISSFPPMEPENGRFTHLKNTFVYRSSTPYNIYLLAAIMENHDYEVTVRDYISETCELEKALEELLSFDLIMISCNSWNWYPSRWIIEHLRETRKDQIIVVGGLQATLFGKKIIDEFPVDYVIRGEGEKSIIPLLKLIEGKGREQDVPGLIYKCDGGIYLNPVATLLSEEEMSLLPVPLYEKLPSASCNWLSIESSRGCVNHCIYCSVPYQRNWRPLGAEKFVDRIEKYMPYLNKVVSGKFLFIDDSFIIDVKRSRDIASLLREKDLRIEAIWNGHVPELFEKEMLLELAPYTDSILVGAESFEEESLERIGKTYSPHDITEGAKIGVNLGISHKYIFSFIVGFPWQNKERIMAEIDRIYDLVVSTDINAIINWLILNPGSRIWNEFYLKKNVPLRDYGKLYDLWKNEVFPVSDKDLQEINFYIKYLQDTIPNGIYRFQQHSGIYDKIKDF